MTHEIGKNSRKLDFHFRSLIQSSSLITLRESCYAMTAKLVYSLSPDVHLSSQHNQNLLFFPPSPVCKGVRKMMMIMTVSFLPQERMRSRTHTNNGPTRARKVSLNYLLTREKESPLSRMVSFLVLSFSYT